MCKITLKFYFLQISYSNIYNTDNMNIYFIMLIKIAYPSMRYKGLVFLGYCNICN